MSSQPSSASPDNSSADSLVQQANKLKPSRGLFAFLSPSSAAIHEEKAELYTKAANLYKAQKQWSSAAESFIQAANSWQDAKETYEQSQSLLQAANCFKQCSPPRAVECLEQAITLTIDLGKFSTAARQQKELGELQEHSLSDYPNAVIAYEKGADWYLAEGAKASASECLLKAAKLASEIGNVPKAHQLFSQIVSIDLTMDHGRFVIKEHLFALCLCILLQKRGKAALQEIETCVGQWPSFVEEKEYSFIQGLFVALSEQSIEEFERITGEMLGGSKLESNADKWKMNLLVLMKAILEEEPSFT